MHGQSGHNLCCAQGCGRFDARSGDPRTCESLHEDLHATAQAQHQVQRRLLLDVVIRKRAAVLELLTRKNQTLLVWRDALLVLDLSLDVVDGVRGLDLEGNGLASEGLDKDLHTTTKAKDQVKS